MLTIFLLVVLFTLGDDPQVITQPYNTQAECEQAIGPAVSALLTEGIDTGSVTCSEHTLGNLS